MYFWRALKKQQIAVVVKEHQRVAKVRSPLWSSLSSRARCVAVGVEAEGGTTSVDEPRYRT